MPHRRGRKSCAEIIQKLAQHTVKWDKMSLWGNVVPQKEIIFCYLVKTAFSWKDSECYIHLPYPQEEEKLLLSRYLFPRQKYTRARACQGPNQKGRHFTEGSVKEYTAVHSTTSSMSISFFVSIEKAKEKR